MPKPEGRVVFSNAAADDFKRIRKKVLGGQPGVGDYGGGGHPTNGTWYWCKTASSVNSGTLEVPTTFTYNVWLPDPSSNAFPRPFIVATDSNLLGITGVNRSSFTTGSGTTFKMEYMFGEWTPKWVDC